MKRALTILTVTAAFSLMGVSASVFADTSVLPTEPEMAAIVTVDAGTVFEVTLDAENQVTGIDALDDTGAAILEGMDLTGQQVQDAVGQLIIAAAEEGVLPTDGTAPVDITIVTEEPADPADPVETDTPEGTLEDVIADEIADVIEELEIPVIVTYQNAALERVALAQTLGITPGKLNLIQKYAASTGTPESVVVADWTGVSVKEIMSAIKINRKAAALPETPDAEEPVVTEAEEVTAAAAIAPAVEQKKIPEKGSAGKSGKSSGGKGGKNK